MWMPTAMEMCTDVHHPASSESWSLPVRIHCKRSNSSWFVKWMVILPRPLADCRKSTLVPSMCRNCCSSWAKWLFGVSGCGHPSIEPRLKWAKGRFWSNKYEKIQVLRMSLPIVESLSGPQDSIFSLFRGLQLNSREKSKRN